MYRYIFAYFGRQMKKKSLDVTNWYTRVGNNNNNM